MVESNKHKDIEAVRGDMVKGDKHKFGIHIHGVIDTFPYCQGGKQYHSNLTNHPYAAPTQKKKRTIA